MPEIPVLERLLLSQHRHFRFCEMNFSHPRTGLPLSRVCLTGPNGSGKSTVLNQVYRAFQLLAAPGRPELSAPSSPDDSLALFTVRRGEERFLYAVRGAGGREESAGGNWYPPSIESSSEWRSLPETRPGFSEFVDTFSGSEITDPDQIPRFEAPTALSFFSPKQFLANGRPLESFDAFLAEKRSERQRQYHDYLQRDENRDRTVSEVEREFQEAHPGVLFALEELWRETLAANYLRFRPGHEPAFHCLVTGDDLEFSSLGSGLRTYLLGTADLYSRFFLHPESSEVLLLETPESGLHPTLASELMRIYQAQTGDHPGQLFVETHSDDIAGHFAREEVFAFRFDPQRGILCESTGPVEPVEPARASRRSNGDRTRRSSLQSPRFQKLKRAIRETEDQDELADLIDEVISLRSASRSR